MQDGDEHFRPDAVRRPARNAHSMQYRRYAKKDADDPRGRRESGQRSPARKRSAGEDHRNLVETVERRGRSTRILALDPVCREARDDAAAHDHHEHEVGRNSKTRAVCRCARAPHLDVQTDLREAKHRQNRHDLDVAPIATRDDLECDQPEQSQWKGQGQERDSKRMQGDGESHGEASCEPQAQQTNERPSDDRQAPSPVRNGRQQEARDHRDGVAKQQFMRMPGERRECLRQGADTVEPECPDRDGERRIERAEKEEGTKAVGKKRGARPTAHPIHRGHVLLLAPSPQATICR